MSSYRACIQTLHTQHRATLKNTRRQWPACGAHAPVCSLLGQILADPAQRRERGGLHTSPSQPSLSLSDIPGQLLLLNQCNMHTTAQHISKKATPAMHVNPSPAMGRRKQIRTGQSPVLIDSHSQPLSQCADHHSLGYHNHTTTAHWTHC